MKLKDLYFKFIKDKHLGENGVSAEDLAIALEQEGFVTINSETQEFFWTDKAINGEFKREFWKVIDTCKASGIPPMDSV